MGYTSADGHDAAADTTLSRHAGQRLSQEIGHIHVRTRSRREFHVAPAKTSIGQLRVSL